MGLFLPLGKMFTSCSLSWFWTPQHLNVETFPATKTWGSFSMQTGGLTGISTIREARDLGQLSLFYGIGVMGKGGVSVGEVVCFHNLGFQDWLYQEFNLLGSWLLPASPGAGCEMPGCQP